MNISCQSNVLHFKSPFEISKLRRSSQDVLRVCIKKDGLEGWGETPAISYYGKKVKLMEQQLNAAIPQLEKISWEHPFEWYEALLKYFPDDSYTRSALDGAAWDVYGKLKGKRVWEILNLPNPAKANISNFTIGLGTPEYVVAEIKKYPWPIYKFKLGSAQDREILKAVNQTTDSSIRIDANGAWSFEHTKAFLIFCEKAFPSDFIELIEEPFSSLEDENILRLNAETSIPFYADESFQSMADLDHIGKYFHGINVKLDKCGGLTPALEIIKTAKSRNLKIQLGCMSSSGIALAPAIQLSGLVDVVDLDAAMMIINADFGVHYSNGVAMTGGNTGLGIVI